MKNKNILPGQEVPIEIRIKIYQKAIDIIKSGTPHYRMNTFGLCLILPCILWDLKSYIERAPCGVNWDHFDAQKMFPELNDGFLDEVYKMPQSKRSPIRIEFLQKWIMSPQQ